MTLDKDELIYLINTIEIRADKIKNKYPNEYAKNRRILMKLYSKLGVSEEVYNATRVLAGEKMVNEEEELV
ncbi:MAG: hypothetical protein ACPLRZ_11390 [Thermovenabulum sp.]|uniref:hypothetical protein n=1 Tax=Thermovenabulum sp. TaxID=3100335 RepID=UPI003C7B8E3B